ncbi:helix-turn-helix domain-containing protein [Corynebacterium flavescens]|uniref:HTH cro/C1-type domain-containing protein n=1 Tax=Corynebacterium flavescens TaxID=28028 RepID=A0AB73BAV2_CORFL|nr:MULTISPECIES: helix-turn-helix transcriptional regulator [Corynebacterium]KAA8719722.1 helix-turn-helix transcriptional regulator [Corynebacterium flavescens]GEB98902.1 hypothetical protein CFL01nite_23970 [Corynebacterium flavescens]
MPTKSFDSIASKARQNWSQQAHDVYEASSAAFSAEVAQRAELGSQLLIARKARALSQESLAELAGIQQAEISRIERGISNPTMDTLSRIVRALGMKLTIAAAT